MGKEIATQVQEVQRLPYRINPMRNIPTHILIKLTKIKFKEKNIKSSKGKATNNIQGNPHKVIMWFFSRNSAGQKKMAKYSWSDEKGKPTTKVTLPSKAMIQIEWRNQKLYRQAKAKTIQHHQTGFTTNAKGTFLRGKQKRRKRPTKTNTKQLRKW